MESGLYAKGRVTGFQRAKRNQRTNTSLVQVEGVADAKEAQWYLGKVRQPPLAASRVVVALKVELGLETGCEGARDRARRPSGGPSYGSGSSRCARKTVTVAGEEPGRGRARAGRGTLRATGQLSRLVRTVHADSLSLLRNVHTARRLRLHGAEGDRRLQGPHHLGQGHPPPRQVGHGSRQVPPEPPAQGLRPLGPHRESRASLRRARWAS